MVTKRNRLQNIRQFVIENVKTHPADIGSLLAEEYTISRQGANKYLRRFVEEGLLGSSGNTKSKKYSLAVLASNHVVIDVTPELEEHIVWREHIIPTLGDVAANVAEICQFGFTEMVNNVVEHSESAELEVTISRNATEILMCVQDHGVGIFKKLQNEYGYSDPRHALLELSKGKLTTSQEAHSGEGIFFTSRVFDSFHIDANSLAFIRLNSINPDDWLIEVDDTNSFAAFMPGTSIFMNIGLAAKRNMREVFDAAATEFDDYSFTRTHVPVKLVKYGNEQLVSRSQAKRVLARFDRFKEVMLDFQGIETIGPAFADEIFRVFPNQHGEIQLVWMNTTPAIEQMISRARSG